MKKILLRELLHLDAPLITAQLTNKGESLIDIPWSNKKFNFKPYCVFERKDGLLYAYYDREGIDWKIEEAGKYDEKTVIRKVKDYYSRIKNIFQEERALSLKEFPGVIEIINEMWTWLDCMWWLIEYRDKNKLDLPKLMALRKETEYFAPGSIAVIRKSIVRNYPNLDKYKDVLLLEEVLSGNIPSEAILKERLLGCVYTDGRLFKSLDDVKQIFPISLYEEKAKGQNELVGQTAYPGKVVGTVRVIRKREEMNTFKPGEIIVASTTTPDFLPIMKICGAIISEHGGVICHASITSRELKIPCIVGVKAATKILKDGNRVEVDADNGIIRILK